MSRSSFSCKMSFMFLASSILMLLCVSSVQAYDFNNWNIDGYLKSQFGVFTENTKPFNKAEFGGSDDNIATARQQMRWNINGQISKSVGLKAEVLGAWEPEYPGEKGTEFGGQGKIGANYYNSFDWRELTIEYKPTYSHTIRFGRQIINWGEAISGRVVDECNPVDSRYLLGFTNLEESYMPLWMFRGIHDFYNWNTNIEWIAAPIWQADRYEHARSMTVSGTRQGDGESWGNPWYRFGSNPEGRVNKFNGADMAVYATSGQPAKIYGPPFATGYHGTDLLGGSGAPLNYATAAAFTPFDGYLTDANILWTEFPSTDGLKRSSYGPKYTDHNLKNTRWGLKSKHMLWGAEVGLSFYQGPAHSGSYHYKDRLAISPLAPHLGYLLFEYEIPRYNTFGLFGNYQTPFGIFVFEGAYKPDREYHKNLYGLASGRSLWTASGPGLHTPGDPIHEARLNNVEQVDLIHTLLGVTREQNVPFLNKYNVFTIRSQWQALWYLEDTAGLSEVTTYFMEPEQVDHEFLVSISTSYSYRKYSPGLTFVFNPRGQLYSSASFTWIPDGFNSRLSVNAGYTNIWGANDYSTRTVLAAKNDLAVLTVQYDFY